MVKRSSEQISSNMKKIKSKDTKIELSLRKELWLRGYRYRKNVKSVFGHPDIAFIGRKIAIFCDSEFWHGYDWENRKQDIKSNQEFWVNKIERNIKRDLLVNQSLHDQGWTVLRFNSEEILKDLPGCIMKIEKVVNECEDNL